MIDEKTLLGLTAGRPLWKVVKRTADGIDETVCPDPEDDDRFRRVRQRVFVKQYLEPLTREEP